MNVDAFVFGENVVGKYLLFELFGTFKLATIVPYESR